MQAGALFYLLQWVGIGNLCTNNAGKCIKKRQNNFLSLSIWPVNWKKLMSVTYPRSWKIQIIPCWVSYRLNFTPPSHKFSRPSTGRHATTLISRLLTRSTHCMPSNLANYHLLWDIIIRSVVDVRSLHKKAHRSGRSYFHCDEERGSNPYFMARGRISTGYRRSSFNRLNRVCSIKWILHRK